MPLTLTNRSILTGVGMCHKLPAWDAATPPSKASNSC